MCEGSSWPALESCLWGQTRYCGGVERAVPCIGGVEVGHSYRRMVCLLKPTQSYLALNGTPVEHYVIFRLQL